MKQRGMKYDNSIDLYPISDGEVYKLSDGSSITINDITEGIPAFMKEADCVFIDPAGNKGVLKSYYNKAELDCPYQSFEEFCQVIMQRIIEINPDRLFVECFSTNRKALTEMVQRLYPCVKVYNSTYYHSQKYKAWIVQGTRQPEEYPFEGIDEENVIYKICEVVPLNCIADFFMGRGLVAESAYKSGKKFFGSDMNRNRLAVAIRRVADRGGVWNVEK